MSHDNFSEAQFTEFSAVPRGPNTDEIILKWKWENKAHELRCNYRAMPTACTLK